MKNKVPNENGRKPILKKLTDSCVSHPMISVGLYVCAVSLFFFIFPGADIWSTGLFYSEVFGFWAKNMAFLRDVRYLGIFLVQVVATTCVAVFVLKLLIPDRPPLSTPPVKAVLLA